MPSEVISEVRIGLAKAGAQLQHVAQTTERMTAKALTSSNEAVAQSRDLLDRVGRRFDELT